MKYKTVHVTDMLHRFGHTMLISATRMPWPTQPMALPRLRIQVISASPWVSLVRTTRRNWGKEIAAATSAPLSAMTSTSSTAAFPNVQPTGHWANGPEPPHASPL